MKVFVTGATGFVGSAVVRELMNEGHSVLGLVRSKEGEKALSDLGAGAYWGDLNDAESLRKAAASADGIIHTAFNHDFSRFAESCENDRRIIEVLGSELADGRPLVVTSGIGLLPGGRLVDESDSPAAGHNPRVATELGADAAARKGARVSVVRLPPTVHGEGDRGFIPMLIGIAREKGVSVYQNEEPNYWPAVHRLDAARLFRLALEKEAPAGTRYHVVAEEGIPFTEIATAIAEGLNVPLVAMTKTEAAAHFGPFAHFAAMDIRASGEKTRSSLGWQAVHPGLLSDLRTDIYFKS